MMVALIYKDEYVMVGSYKYSPEEFTDMLGMADDLALFYSLFETYSSTKSRSDLFALEKQARDLFFTIKHRALAGCITAATAQEMKLYIEDLLND